MPCFPYYRPPLPSYSACFQSIFRIHTETGNIWTHLIGCVAFVTLAVSLSIHISVIFSNITKYFLWIDLHTGMVRLADGRTLGFRCLFRWAKNKSKIFLCIFFKNPFSFCIWFSIHVAGAIICLGLSCTYHTVHCHSEFVGKLFSKLDYVGISFLILGSLVPWLYYSFYCQYQPKLIYLIVASVLGTIAIIVSLWDQFSAPEYRSFRAGNLTWQEGLLFASVN